MIVAMQDPEEWLAAMKTSFGFDENEPRVARVLELRRKPYGGGRITQKDIEEIQRLEDALMDDAYKKNTTTP